MFGVLVNEVVMTSLIQKISVVVRFLVTWVAVVIYVGQVRKVVLLIVLLN